MKSACLFFTKDCGPFHMHEGKGCYVNVMKIFLLFWLEKNLKDEPSVSRCFGRTSEDNLLEISRSLDFPAETFLLANVCVSPLTYIVQIIKNKTNTRRVAEACGKKNPLHRF